MSVLVTDFSRLAAMVEQIGVSINASSEEMLRALDTGVEVDSAIEFIGAPSGFFDLLPNGDIVRVIIHLNAYQTKTFRGQQHADPSVWHKYHLTNCASIKGAKPTRRLRYVKTRRTDGRFAYRVLNRSGKDLNPSHFAAGRPLVLCGTCRNAIAKMFYFEDFDRDFSLPDFIDDYKSSATRFQPMPFRHDGDEIRGFRRDDWLAITNYAKERAGWQCSECSLDLHDYSDRKYLHAHVENGALRESLGNIRVLCIRCHANVRKDSAHRRISNTHDYREFEKQFK